MCLVVCSKDEDVAKNLFLLRRAVGMYKLPDRDGAGESKYTDNQVSDGGRGRV
jgi:hypothetical protein